MCTELGQVESKGHKPQTASPNPRVWNAEMERLFDVWVQHVDLLIEEPAGVAGIHFDRRWLVDRQYRLEIGQKLGLQRPGNRP
jgi:hypothetical protein